MNEQTSFELAAPVAAKARSRVALLVDGDNISHSLAGPLIMQAIRHGDLTIKRVYGNFTSLPGWSEAPGFRAVHAGTGKNAADVLLCIEAMAVILKGQADVLVIATSDGDFSHLALTLVEQGHKVVGLGESKAPDKFRKACHTFYEIAERTDQTKLSGDVAAIPIHSALAIDAAVLRLIATNHDNSGSLLLGGVGTLLKVAGLTRDSIGGRSWSSYFRERPDIYRVWGEGHGMRVSAAVTP